MSESYFSLSKDDQVGLISKYAPTLAMQPFVVEKDIWVCWVLDKLFSMPNRMKMVFKGGTSLSKVYKAIDRFSEDIDVTIDYREFVAATTGKESRGNLTRLSDKLKGELLAYTKAKIKPLFESKLSEEFDGKDWKVELSEDGEKLLIHYPSAFDEGGGYVPSTVLLEFGGRNITEPNETHTIRPDIAELETEISFPSAKVMVLALLRTFWEKATLAHVEYHRPTLRTSAERWSRHWYDLYQLSHDLETICSDSSLELLKDVVKHKKEFFHYGYAKYDDCIEGELRLVPTEYLQELLFDDFSAMTKAQMFYKKPPKFNVILERLKEVEDAINASRKNQSR